MFCLNIVVSALVIKFIECNFIYLMQVFAILYNLPKFLKCVFDSLKIY